MIIGTTTPPSISTAFTSTMTLDILDSERRLWEGWISVDGIDWEDEGFPSTVEVFRDAAAEYMAKIPVVLWNHDTDFPIGRILDIQVHEGVGVWAKGEILRAQDFGFETSEEGENANLAILNKCNEVWGLIKTRIVKGLSWNGRARKQYTWAEALGRYIKQTKKVLLIREVTITSIQASPGSQITGFNEVAKALGTTAEAQIMQEGKMNANLLELKKAMATVKTAIQALPDGTELPQDIAEMYEEVSKALGVEVEPEPVVEEDEVMKSLPGKMSSLADKLTSFLNEPAALVNRTGQPSGAKEKPVVEPGSFDEGVNKTLGIIGTIEDGVTQKGKGDTSYIMPTDAAKLIMLRSNGRIRHGEFTISPACQALLKEHVA
mgnify:CR=1 FL=1